MANPPPSSSSSPPLLLPPPNPTHSSPTSPSDPPPSPPKLKPKSENDLIITTSSPAVKRTPPLPWTHLETISLIQAYQEKWYSLKKGQLKANQWDDVSVSVASRCGYEDPTKTATQCRHKIEKLRKRYRAERVKPYPNSWQYFELMDRMERGPLPIAAAIPIAAVKRQNSNSGGNYEGDSDSDSDSDDDDDGDVSYGGLDVKKNKLKSINNIVRGDLGMRSNSNRNLNRMPINRNFGGGGSGSDRILRAMRNPMIEKRKSHFENDESDEDEGEDEEEEAEEDEEEERRGVVGKELAAEIRGFAERFMRMENKKIEMMRETERYRMEMENKRMEMILESQRKIVDTIGRAFGAHKKVKMTPEI